MAGVPAHALAPDLRHGSPITLAWPEKAVHAITNDAITNDALNNDALSNDAPRNEE